MLKTTVLAVVLATGAAGCIESGVTEGTTTQELSAPDTVHTGVGSLVYRQLSGDLWNVCSGALISPTVFLTAGHCTEAMKGYAATWGKITYVTFDQQVTPGSPVIEGTPITAPDYKPVT